MTDKAFDLDGEIENPHAFIQWKGTKVCMDFHCECGALCHFDGYFAYVVKCPHCNTAWQMPSNLFPLKVDARTYEGHVINAQLLVANAKTLNPDEDMPEK